MSPTRPAPTARYGAVRTLLLTLALLAAQLLAPLSHAAEWNLDALMHALAQHASGRASFVETKTMAMLDQPIESSGELRFAAPDFLEMRTLKPKPQTVILQANQLTVELGGRSRQLNLADHPDIAVLVDSIRATLNGDRQALQRDYMVSLDGDAAQWTMRLVPVGAKARARVRDIRIAGSQGAVRSIAVQQTDGDHSLMTIREQASP
jgi:hypothetical protein